MDTAEPGAVCCFMLSAKEMEAGARVATLKNGGCFTQRVQICQWEVRYKGIVHTLGAISRIVDPSLVSALTSTDPDPVNPS